MEWTTAIAGLRLLIDQAQSDWKKDQQGLRTRFAQETTKAIADHHVFVSRWCQEAHAVGLGGIDVDAPTVELSFRAIPRRVGIAGRDLDELDVLVTRSHVAVLGDPGAGKTTTLRRLAKAVALEPEESLGDEWRFVIVVVCRDEDWKYNTLYDVLGNRLGVTGKLAAELDNRSGRIRDVLNIGALIVIDGLDEVPSEYRADLERSIEQLGRHLTKSKLVVSCRSADYVVPLAGFETAEIKPLTATQIDEIVGHLLSPEESESFFTAVHAPGHPAGQLANRPLFLLQMLAIYRRRGTIPDRPVELCEAIIRLILHEWDEIRRVRRVSKYGQFGVEEKRRFLADLAYVLLRERLIRFDEADLERVYKQLAERYGLPGAEARLVARELESHTGLLVQSGELYEFSHLSLQEYLAADAMVRGAGSATESWWSLYPAVTAVATALSSNANAWLHDLLIKLPREAVDPRHVQAFLRRLSDERPRFVRDASLGHDLLEVFFRVRISDPEAVAGLNSMKPVRASVADAVGEFDSVSIRGDVTRLSDHAGDSPIASKAIAVSTPVLRALVGPELFRQIELESGRKPA